MSQTSEQTPQSPLREIVQPFIDLVHAPRALWGINLGYVIEGMVYFGFLGYLAIYFSDFVFQGVENPDVYSHHMVMVLTAGITFSMAILGFVPDKFGVRRAMLLAFCLLLAGRVIISGSPLAGLEPSGLWSPLHIATMVGILLVVLGYGMYQPAAYAAVRQFTNPKTAAMGFAMLYALMNLGGYLPTFAFLLRDDDYVGIGINGVFWFYTALTLVALVATAVILSRSTVANAIATAKRETAEMKAADRGEEVATAAEVRTETEGLTEGPEGTAEPSEHIPFHLWVLWLGLAIIVATLSGGGWRIAFGAVLLAVPVAVYLTPGAIRHPVRRWIAAHPLADAKFSFFIFALIPVQTLFVYNWMILPQYINRAYEGWIGEYFEIGANFNPLLIFIMVPIVTALTQKRKVYNMMILGTFIMAAPAFLLAVDTSFITLLGYIVIMTIGEAMWQPRFLQYAAEIAPEGKTGIYMGVAQFPWFLTKFLVPLYTGYALARYVPPEGEQNPEAMWLIFGFIAISSTVMLVLAKGWLGKDFKTTADA